MTRTPRSEQVYTPDETIEEIAFLTRSPTRLRILKMASAAEGTTRYEFRARLDASRTTVQRNVEALVDRGWLEETTSGYVSTPCGTLLARKLSTVVDSIETLCRLEPVLSHLPLGELDMAIRHFGDAELTAATANDPYAPVNRHVDALRSADKFRVFTAVVGREAFKLVCDRALRGECSGQLILTEGGLQTVQTESGYRDSYEKLARTGAVDILVYERDLPYYLGLLDDVVQIGVEDSNNVPSALLETDNKRVREWARGKYESIRGHSTLPSDT